MNRLLIALAFFFQITAAASSPEDVVLSGRHARVSGSSFLKEATPHSFKMAFDGDPKTAWVVRTARGGVGSELVVTFDKPVTVFGFRFLPGYTKSYSTLINNLIPKSLRLLADNQPVASVKRTLFKADNFVNQEDEGKKEWLRGETASESSTNFEYRYFLFSKPVTAKVFKLEILSVFPALKYSDLALSEWEFWFGEKSPQESSRIFQALASLQSANSPVVVSKEKNLQGLSNFAKIYSEETVSAEPRLKANRRKCFGAFAEDKEPVLPFLRRHLIGVPVFVQRAAGNVNLVGGTTYSERETTASDYVECFTQMTLNKSLTPQDVSVAVETGSVEL